MRHNLTLEGLAFRLRPVTDADAAFLLKLRCNPLLNRFLNTTSVHLEDQLAWLALYYERPGDYYFIVERLQSGAPEGVISVYSIDYKTKSAEWGRWILNQGSLAAVESAWLIYRCSFEQLDLKQVCCRTVADNLSAVSFHDSCGITDRFLLPKYFKFDDKLLDAVEHRVDQRAWFGLNLHLEKLANITARRLQRG